MWIGSLKLVTHINELIDSRNIDYNIHAEIYRDKVKLCTLFLKYEYNNYNSIVSYSYSGPTQLPRKNDETPVLKDGVSQIPMPYPGYGLEYSNGLSGHLVIKLRTRRECIWIKDRVDLYVVFINKIPTNFNTLAWREDDYWTYISSWDQGKSVVNNINEGNTIWELILAP